MRLRDNISTLGHLEHWANVTPDRTFLEEARDGGGLSRSFAALHGSALRWAQALRSAGLRPGDVVVTFIPTSIDAVECWLGIAWLRCIDAGIHTDYRGDLLRRLANAVTPKAVIVAEPLIDRLEEVLPDIPGLRVVIALGSRRVTCPATVTSLLASELLAAAEPATDMPAPRREDTACVVFTSGTTGQSKPVVVPWGNYLGTLPVWSDLTSDDAFYSPFALCHSAGRSPFTWIGVPGGRWVIRDRFRTDRFWPDIQVHECTVTQLIPAMIEWLMSAPGAGDLRQVPLRRAVTAPLSARVVEFQDQFGIDIRTVYGMSEVGMVISRTPRIDADWRSCGRPTPGFEVRVVDENDYELPPGQVGELIVRSDRPWSLNGGYFGMPEESLRAWRNGWFHTGDALRASADGDYYFVDRKKDALRRRGENVSSRELEEVVSTYSGISECAVIGVPAGGDEEEIKVVAVLADGGDPDPGRLIRHLADRVPGFMVPRYVEFVASLPRTEVTGRVQKARLREQPLTPGTWDRLAARPVSR
jgi:crotonobetaine/carnitine-CoA ligase